MDCSDAFSLKRESKSQKQIRIKNGSSIMKYNQDARQQKMLERFENYQNKWMNDLKRIQ